ncbi:MAG TPA: (5-formylfuran-3-yl)methyl phosphate synthase [Solirubrobacteraceae bacterium]|nr:(5-formylfuran-3-yl)methyl phosphate synthase [Solirubrobacteraceae bacterium]
MRLLVSVVSAEEARLALAGGADIIDVKDPRAGALGAPSPSVLSEVVSVVGDAAPVSVALGDDPGSPSAAALAAHAAAAAGARFIKIGLRGVSELDSAVELVYAVAHAVEPGVAVIAAGYADASALDPPALAPRLLPVVVERTAVAGALVDTFVKDGRGLYGWLSVRELADLIDQTHSVGGSFAVAGQLRLGELGRVGADVVGVRGAVCAGGERTAQLEEALVAAAVAELHGTLAL